MVTNQDIAYHTYEHPLFRGVDAKDLDLITSEFITKTARAGSEPFLPKTSLTSFTILLKGRMKLFTIHPDSGNEFSNYLLTKGDMFSVLSLLDSEKHNMRSEALDDLVYAQVSIERMRSWLVSNQAISSNTLRYLAVRMRRLEKNMIDQVFYDTTVRLARLIFLNIKSDSHDLNLINNLSHDEIAQLIGTTRAVVNRNIQALKKEGIITVERKQILVQDLEKLKLKLKDY